MNEIFATLYETFFDWDTYQQLLTFVYNNNDYSKLGWLSLVLAIVIPLLFYKIWDPVSKSKLKYWLTIILNSALGYGVSSIILYNNFEIIQYISNYTGDVGQPDADYFIVQMSLITLVLVAILSISFSVLIFKRFSTNNSKNPF